MCRSSSFLPPIEPFAFRRPTNSNRCLFRPYIQEVVVIGNQVRANGRSPLQNQFGISIGVGISWLSGKFLAGIQYSVILVLLSLRCFTLFSMTGLVACAGLPLHCHFEYHDIVKHIFLSSETLDAKTRIREYRVYLTSSPHI